MVGTALIVLTTRGLTAYCRLLYELPRVLVLSDSAYSIVILLSILESVTGVVI